MTDWGRGSKNTTNADQWTYSMDAPQRQQGPDSDGKIWSFEKSFKKSFDQSGTNV